MIYIAPSMLSADFSNLGNEARRMKEIGADYLHLDVMDGAFVPNLSFGAQVIAAIRPYSDLVFDVHLMINEPIRFLDDFVKAGADIITIHLESCLRPQQAIDAIKAKNLRVGVAVSPETPVEKLIPYLSEIDMALIMTVHPGFGGQSFIPECLEKVTAVRRYATAHNLNPDIEVDGGLNAQTTSLSVAAGANVIVAGSSIFKAPSPEEMIKTMRKNADANPYRA